MITKKKNFSIFVQKTKKKLQLAGWLADGRFFSSNGRVQKKKQNKNNGNKRFMSLCNYFIFISFHFIANITQCLWYIDTNVYNDDDV